jgi:hypothetical protein
MARTTHELWLEDRQGVIDRGRDRAWWRCLHWCSSVGLLLAVVQWGWVVPSAVVLASVAISVLLFVACLGKVDLARVRVVVDVSALTTLATVGAAGLVAAWAAAGLLIVLVLTLTSPAVRRSLRDARTAMRLALVLARAARKRTGESPW